ncbi:hypothetical protein BDF20DRAFT_844834 [Mycotypha africana]|uniref:uncharacterized protein n=1 Tax=Mycotypha africana TaxID=64632 RepID=UPI002300C737|nr:uncharacterized protein BDF20DRAFT_844834 [Mycotypha africana]KAI8991469.1 hypothetical protein BDF20DRAFT_844834 [Mycotypha africana]
MKTIGSTVDPAIGSFFEHRFVTAAMQYELMIDIFPSLSRKCNKVQLQYWVGQSIVWGPLEKARLNGKVKYGRNLWILRKETREHLIELNDSMSSYWQHVRASPDVLNIGYARKSTTKETDMSRSHLLQLMVDKLHFRLKCQEVYVSQCCAAKAPILNPRFAINPNHTRIAKRLSRRHRRSH